MKNYDIAIVGAGAAGMTAAIYGLRARKTVIVFEKTTPGGQILATTKIENYPGIDSISGQEFGEKLKAQVKKFGGKILTAEVSKIVKTTEGFAITTDEGDFAARTVILANGSREKRLGLDREAELTGKGVSYCATCDGALFKGKSVAVYGGGNTAAYSVLYLAGICQKVFWIFRKPAPRAEKHLVEKIKTLDNVETLSSTVISGFCGEEQLTGLKFTDGHELSLDGLFILIGREPDNQPFAELVDLDSEGYIKSDESCHTSVEGVFCAGDNRKKPLNQLVTATADGAVAAHTAISSL